MNIKNTCDVIEQTGAVGCTTVDLHRSCLFGQLDLFLRMCNSKARHKIARCNAVALSCYATDVC